MNQVAIRAFVQQVKQQTLLDDNGLILTITFPYWDPLHAGVTGMVGSEEEEHVEQLFHGIVERDAVLALYTQTAENTRSFDDAVRSVLLNVNPLIFSHVEQLVYEQRI